MRFEGWNHTPEGYGARFDVQSASLWLRVFFHTPVLDRFAYPALVSRGHGYLRQPLDASAQDLGVVTTPVGASTRLATSRRVPRPR